MKKSYLKSTTDSRFFFIFSAGILTVLIMFSSYNGGGKAGAKSALKIGITEVNYTPEVGHNLYVWEKFEPGFVIESWGSIDPEVIALSFEQDILNFVNRLVMH